MKTKIMIREAAFYKTLFALALPMAGQNMITFAISMMDTLMVGQLQGGQLGGEPLAAAAFANQVTYVFMILTFGIGSGANVLIAQFWGKRDLKSMHNVITIMYRFALAGITVFTLSSFFFPVWLMRLFSNDPVVIDYGVAYLRIIGIGYLFSGFTNTTIIMLRSVGTVRVSLVVYIASLISNTTLNYIMIFGKLGFPALGIRGAAIATVISRMLESAIVIYFLIRHEDKIRYNMLNLFKGTQGMTRRYSVTGLPVIVNELIWASGAASIVAIIGKLGTELGEANAIATVMAQLVTVMIYGVSNAAAATIGNTVGEGNYDRARLIGRTMMVIAVCLGLVSSLVLFSLRGLAVSLYPHIPQTAKDYAMEIMGVHSLLVIFQSVANIGLVGVLRGGGDAKVVLVLDILFMWILAIPLGWFVGHRLGAAVPVVYFCLKCDELIKSTVCSIRIFRGRWIKDFTLTDAVP